MEQFAEAERWDGSGQYADQQDSDSTVIENPRFSTEHSPGARHDAPLTTENSLLARRNAPLRSIVEGNILPHLARLWRQASPSGVVAVPLSSDDDTQKLVGLLLQQDASDASDFLHALRLRGATPGALLLGVMTRAARVLGEIWEQDCCDFAQVTIGLGRLQQGLRGLSPHFQAGAMVRAQPETVLLAPGPGEQHTFGLLILGEFFSREGWRLAGGPATSASDTMVIVRRSWVDVVGFSVGSLARLEALTQAIQAVRRASRNPNLYVMVGGPLFLTRPDLVARTGADAAAADAAGAVRQANALLGMGAAAD